MEIICAGNVRRNEDKMSKILNVLYQSDDNYALPTGISMLSLFENNKHLDEINIYYLDDCISEKNIAKLKKIAEDYGRNLIFLDTTNTLKRLKELNVTPYKNTYTTYFKLLTIKDLDLPTDRILQIDGDTIINQPLDELIEMDLEGHICAATYASILNEYKEMIGIDANDKYYNCGVLMINQKYWREHDCEKQILDHLLHKRNRYFIVDQDIINILFRDNIKYMHIKFNFNSGWYIYGLDESIKIYNFKDQYYSTRQQIEEAMAKPYIDHCMGAMTGRPWEKNNIHPQNDNFNKYLAMSPWTEDDKLEVRRGFMFRAQKRLYLMLPKCIYWRIHRIALKRYMKKMNAATLVESDQ